MVATELLIRKTFLAGEDREAIRRLAKQNARCFGMTAAQWERRRRQGGYATGRDILMALDPEGERAGRR